MTTDPENDKRIAGEELLRVLRQRNEAERERRRRFAQQLEAGLAAKYPNDDDTEESTDDDD